jgi:hypothetical protein
MSQVAAEFDSEAGANFSLSASAANLSTPVASDIFLAASFYGQSLVTLTSFGMQDPSEPALSATDACNEGGTSGTGYHDGSGTYPAVGDNVYSDSAGTTPLANGFYRINSGQAMEVEDDQVTGLSNCGRSDRRLKRNIIFRSYSKSGIPVYEFEYINKSDGEGRYVGTMAQDLLKLGKSKAVITDKEGYYLVNYDKIDVNFYEI